MISPPEILTVIIC